MQLRAVKSHLPKILFTLQFGFWLKNVWILSLIIQFTPQSCEWLIFRIFNFLRLNVVKKTLRKRNFSQAEKSHNDKFPVRSDEPFQLPFLCVLLFPRSLKRRKSCQQEAKEMCENYFAIQNIYKWKNFKFLSSFEWKFFFHHFLHGKYLSWRSIFIRGKWLKKWQHKKYQRETGGMKINFPKFVSLIFDFCALLHGKLSCEWCADN